MRFPPFVFSQKATKWCLFGAFLLFMPSIYYAVVALALFTPVHMVSQIFPAMAHAWSFGLGSIKSLHFINALNLAVYLPFYYGLSAFLARKLFEVTQVQTRQTIIALLIVGISALGFTVDYGPPKKRGRPQPDYTWLRVLLNDKDWVYIDATPRRAIAPGKVSLRVQASLTHDTASIAWDLDEDGETEIQGADKYLVEYTYQKPGLYHPQVFITDKNGNRFEATLDLPILDQRELESRLSSQWKGLPSLLSEGDKNTLEQFTTHVFRKNEFTSEEWRKDLKNTRLTQSPTPLSIVETYESSTRGDWIVILQSNPAFPIPPGKSPVEVGFLYNYDFEDQYRIFFSRKLPENYTLESYLSSQWAEMVNHLQKENIETASKYFLQYKQKETKKLGMSGRSELSDLVHRLQMPMHIVKHENNKITLQSFSSQNEAALPGTLYVVFQRDHEGKHKIESYTIRLTNEELQTELNRLWMAMWEALAQGHTQEALKYIRTTRSQNSFYDYFTLSDSQKFTSKEWINQNINWRELADQFHVPLTMIKRCPKHGGEVALIHKYPLGSGKEISPSLPDNYFQPFLKVKFRKFGSGLWYITHHQFYKHKRFGSSYLIRESTKRKKEFDLCFRKK